MSDFAPPTGPPPPRVPEGWKAIWNDQYKEWFYVNIYTKQSQWDKPTEAARDPSALGRDAPPSYDHNNAPVTAGMDSKKTLESNNPYHSNTAESDEALARRLQEEENARRHGNQDRGASDSYYGANSAGYGQGAHQSGSQGSYPSAPDYSQQQQQQQQYQSQDAARGKSGGGLFGKLKDKLAAGSGGSGGSYGSRPMGAPMMGYNAGGYPSHGYGGGYPQQGYGGGYPQQGYGGGYQSQGMYGAQPKKSGMGVGGAAALGVGGGLLGGVLLADALDDDDHGDYGGNDDYGGGDDGGDGGGD